LVEAIGKDGYKLLTAIPETPHLNWLHHIRAVQILRQVRLQQFEVVEGKIGFRSDENIPLPAQMICSPYDIDATDGRKVTTWWVG
jgi:hypothetical protein